LSKISTIRIFLSILNRTRHFNDLQQQNIHNNCRFTGRWISIIVLPTESFAKSAISTFNISALSRDIRQLTEKQGSDHRMSSEHIRLLVMTGMPEFLRT